MNNVRLSSLQLMLSNLTVVKVNDAKEQRNVRCYEMRGQHVIQYDVFDCYTG
jgi:hypothetical protein